VNGPQRLLVVAVLGGLMLLAVGALVVGVLS
jgi:hypothetical protein